MFSASAITLLAVAFACDRQPELAAAVKPSTQNSSSTAPSAAAAPTLASLSPAATDLLLGMGAADHVIAISNFDAERQASRNLPRVGDYRTQDWEKLASLRPDKMIIQIHEDRLPAGLRGRAQELGIRLVNIRIDDLDDVFMTIPQLGEAAGEQEKADEALRRLRWQFEVVRQRVEKAPKVRALIVVDDGGRSVAGPETFLHDILLAAGGENAAASLGTPWPTVDREKILELAPQVVIHLLPEAPPQVVRQAQKFWADLPELSAVKDKRVHVITDWYALLPGHHVGQLAEQFALILHPFANARPMGPTTTRGRTAPPPTDLLKQSPPPDSTTGPGSP